MSLDLFSENDKIIVKQIIDFFYIKDFFSAEKNLQILKLKYPNNFFLENIHGSILSSQNKYEEAILKFNRVININPNFADGYYNLATVFKKTNKVQEAIYFFKKSLDINLDYFNSYFNLGDCHRRLGQIDEAIKNYNYYIEKKPDDVEAYNNLGIIYFDIKNYELAKINFNKALSIDMSSINANFYIALILIYEENEFLAINFLKKTIDLDKKFYPAYSKLAELYKIIFRYYDAISTLNDFINFNSDQKNNLAHCYSSLANIQIEVGDIENAYKNFELSLLNDNPALIKTFLFNLNYLKKNNSKKYFDLVNSYRLKLDIKKYNLDKSLYKKHKKIKIGFLSSDLREHAVGYQILGVIEKLSLDKDLELYCYSLNKLEKEEDDLTKKFKLLFENWFDVFDMNAKTIAEKVYSDKIQILFDLNGYTGNNLIEVFMHKPSPLQISWAGCLASTGLQEIEYIIVDPHVVTSNFSNFFTEKPLILKDIWSILTCFEEVKISNQIPFYKNGFITFGSFNNLPKINENVVKIWSKILINVKDSKLRLIARPFKDEQVIKYFKKLFNLQGIKSERLIFDGDYPRKELFNNYNFIDIALDTYPYGGGTTTLEAAWMCVPTLTCAGDTFLSRCGKSINTNLGLNNWICKNDEEYISKAVKFSSDPESLQKTKKFLLENKNQSKLFNSEIFAKNFSESLKKVWEDYITTN